MPSGANAALLALGLSGWAAFAATALRYVADDRLARARESRERETRSEQARKDRQRRTLDGLLPAVQEFADVVFVAHPGGAPGVEEVQRATNKVTLLAAVLDDHGLHERVLDLVAAGLAMTESTPNSERRVDQGKAFSPLSARLVLSIAAALRAVDAPAPEAVALEQVAPGTAASEAEAGLRGRLRRRRRAR